MSFGSRNRRRRIGRTMGPRPTSPGTLTKSNNAIATSWVSNLLLPPLNFFGRNLMWVCWICIFIVSSIKGRHKWFADTLRGFPGVFLFLRDVSSDGRFAAQITLQASLDTYQSRTSAVNELYPVLASPWNVLLLLTLE